MRKFIFLIILVSIIYTTIIQAQYKHDLVLKNEFKNDMLKAIESESITDSLYKVVKKIDDKDALTLGYLGTLEALKAKHSWNPYQKFKYIKKGINTLDTAIKSAQNYLELRFMRYTIEYYTPAFLGLSKHLKVDQSKMISLIQEKKFNKEELTLVKAIAKFLIETKTCSTKQLAILNPYAKI